jgi:hypothetical protein
MQVTHKYVSNFHPDFAHPNVCKKKVLSPIRTEAFLTEHILFTIMIYVRLFFFFFLESCIRNCGSSLKK